MKKLSELFHLCAYDIEYQTIGDSVNYAFLEEGKTLLVFFQGSNSITDWVENFLFTKKIYKEFKVHRGFYMAYSQARDMLLDKIYNNHYEEVMVVGYSHGGALCQLYLEDLVYHFPELKVKGFAFESPRAVKCAKKYKERWKDLLVIRTNQDLVTHCPPKIFGYTDLGTMLKIKGDTSLVENKLPKCIKSHFPQVVYDALLKYEE